MLVVAPKRTPKVFKAFDAEFAEFIGNGWSKDNGGPEPLVAIERYMLDEIEYVKAFGFYK